MKYTLKVITKSKLAAVYAQYCAEGKAGEILIKAGCNTDAFATFASLVAQRALENGEDAPTLAERFKNLCIGNASQVRQAIQELQIEIDGEKAQSISTYWQKSGLVEQPIVSRLGAI